MIDKGGTLRAISYASVYIRGVVNGGEISLFWECPQKNEAATRSHAFALRGFGQVKWRKLFGCLVK